MGCGASKELEEQLAAAKRAQSAAETQTKKLEAELANVKGELARANEKLNHKEATRPTAVSASGKAEPTTTEIAKAEVTEAIIVTQADGTTRLEAAPAAAADPAYTENFASAPAPTESV